MPSRILGPGNPEGLRLAFQLHPKLPDSAYDGLMSGDCSVGEVETENIGAGLDEFPKHLGGIAGRTNGANDFRAPHID